MGMLFGKASGRTFKRFGTTIRFRNRNPLKVKSSDTHPFLIKSPSEALEGSISMAVFSNRRVNPSAIRIRGGSLLYEQTRNASIVPAREIWFGHLQEPYRHGAHGDQFRQSG